MSFVLKDSLLNSPIQDLEDGKRSALQTTPEGDRRLNRGTVNPLVCAHPSKPMRDSRDAESDDNAAQDPGDPLKTQRPPQGAVPTRATHTSMPVTPVQQSPCRGVAFCSFGYCGQPSSKTLTWKIPEVHNSSVLSCMPFQVA